MEKFTELGGEIVYSDLFPENTKDFSAPLAKFKDKDFELFFMAAMITEGSLIVNQMRKLGIDQPLITNNSLMMKEYLDIVGENAEGQIILSYFADEGNTEDLNNSVQLMKEISGKTVEHPCL